MSRHTGEGGGTVQYHQISHGGGGSKIGQKSVTFYLNRLKLCFCH